MDVYLIFVGKSSTRKAAIGPYTIVTYRIMMNTTATIFQYPEVPSFLLTLTSGFGVFLKVEVYSVSFFVSIRDVPLSKNDVVVCVRRASAVCPMRERVDFTSFSSGISVRW